MVSQAFLTAKHGSYGIGDEKNIPFTTTDPRWIKRDGSVISQANYPALYREYYCGDALNDTADFGYRCTNPADPDNTRDTAGTYVVLENADYRFDRGVIPGGSRDLWSYEEDEFKEHTHEHNILTALTKNSGTLNYATAGGPNQFAQVTISSTGGDETRPKNSAKIPMIFTGKAA